MIKRMKIVGIFFLCMFFMTTFPGHTYYLVKKSSYNNFLSKKMCLPYIISLISSCCIGAVTGSIARHVEKKLKIEASPMALFLLLLSWMLESELRNEIIAVLKKDLERYNINDKKGLMVKCAWIASWIAYLEGDLDKIF